LRSRARTAERAALISAMVRTGRSSSVTLPRCSTARCTSSESAPLLGQQQHRQVGPGGLRGEVAASGRMAAPLTTLPPPAARRRPAAAAAEFFAAAQTMLPRCRPTAALGGQRGIRPVGAR
jgi:hypothetical protein